MTYINTVMTHNCVMEVLFILFTSVDLSLAVPITNSLTFIFTGLSGKLLGEKFGNKGRL